MSDELIYLETYVLQKDMRLRLPKSILTNMHAQKGITRFEVYYDQINDCLVLKKEKTNNNNN